MNAEQSKSNPPEPPAVLEEEWSAWLEHPTTKTFRALLRKRLVERQEDWVGGAFPNPIENAKAVGEAQTLWAMLSLTVDEVNQGLSDE